MLIRNSRSRNLVSLGAVSMGDSAGIAGAVSMTETLVPEPEWLYALLGIVVLAGLALFMRKRRTGKSGYVIIEEKP